MMVTIDQVSPGDRLPELRFAATASRIVAGALASRDHSPLHHDRDYAVNVANKRDIFANTQFQAALFERYLQDWAGPMARIAQMRFRMIASIFAGDVVTVHGSIDAVSDNGPCGPCATVQISATIDDALVTECTVLVALPAEPGDNPWHRIGERWLTPA